MPTAAEKNAAARKPRTKKDQAADAKDRFSKKSLTDLPEPELRAKLLATPTLPDRAWAPKLGKPERAEGEDRAAYIRRVLKEAE